MSAELGISPQKYLQDLSAASVKLFFDWLKETHQTSIRVASAVNGYWRHLKILYVQETGKLIDEEMRSDCVNVWFSQPSSDRPR